MSPQFQPPDVDCVVVNRDGGDAFFAALNSLKSQTGVDASILVVDNDSQPAERERLAGQFPEARLVTFSRNLGFAGAANEGIARTRSPFVLLLNNDAVLAPDYIARLAARLAFDDRLAAVQGLVLTGDGRRVDTAGLDWNGRGEAVPVLAGASPDDAGKDVFEVSGVSATATLYRRAALQAAAPDGEVFDSTFFAYYEDVDLSLRLARGGWRFACDPAARCRHEGSRTGRRTPARRALWTARNRGGRFPKLRFTPPRAGSSAPAAGSPACGSSVGRRATPQIVWPLAVFAWRSREERALLSEWPRANR